MRSPLVVYHEHPEWLLPLFRELDRRGSPYVRLTPSGPALPDPGTVPAGAVVFNRMSPSAGRRGLGEVVLPTRRFLRALERAGVTVLNGARAYGYEISKVSQMDLLRRLGLNAPATQRVRKPSQVPAAAERLRYPLIFKPNVGGSGTGVILVESRDHLHALIEARAFEFGLDGVGLLQEYHAPRDGFITRVETLDRKFLYALRVAVNPASGFNLCPADACLLTDGPTPEHAGPEVEPVLPDRTTLDRVECIARHAEFDVGGVEYLESERDGQRYFYDLNAMSNFVGDPIPILGFDPWPRLADYLEGRRVARAA